MTEDERKFWDAAFCALLTGQCDDREFYQKPIVDDAAKMADLAVLARRARMEEDLNDGR